MGRDSLNTKSSYKQVQTHKHKHTHRETHVYLNTLIHNCQALGVLLHSLHSECYVACMLIVCVSVHIGVWTSVGKASLKVQLAKLSITLPP